MFEEDDAWENPEDFDTFEEDTDYMLMEILAAREDDGELYMYWMCEKGCDI